MTPAKETTPFMTESNPDPDLPRNDKTPGGNDTERPARIGPKRPSGAARRRAKAERRLHGDGGGAGGPRHQARIMAMQALFELDVTDHDVAETLARIQQDENVPPPVKELALHLVAGTAAHQAELDPLIADAAPAFPLAQLAGTDRAVLRLAVFELLYRHDVPMKAAINEAVEIAKHFGGANSSRFVNGVLGTIAERAGRTATDTAAET